MQKLNNILNKPITRAILWLLLGVSIFLVGIINPKADTLYNNNNLSFLNNNGTSFNAVTTSYVEQINESSAILTTVQNSYGGIVVIQLSAPLIKDHIYSLFLNVGAESGGGKTKLSAKNCLGSGGSVNGAANNYINCQISPRFSDYAITTSDKGRGVFYSFVAVNDAIMLAVPYTSEYTCSSCRNYSYGYTIVDGGNANNLTEQQINTIINNQTSSIQNQITQSQSVTNQTIIDSANSTNQAIINSANNTDSAIVNSANATQDSINNGLQTCTKQLKFTLIKGKAFNRLGALSDNADSYYTENYYVIGDTTKLTLSNVGLSSPDSAGYIIIYDSNKQYLDYWSIIDRTLTLPSGAYYYRLSTTIPSITLYQGEGCTSKIDAVNDTLNDDDTTGATSEASDFFSSFTSNTFGLTSIITAPLNLIQSLTSQTCSPLHIPLPYLTNKYLDLPCMSTIYSQFFGNFFTLYQTITFGIVAYWVCVRIFNQVKD